MKKVRKNIFQMECQFYKITNIDGRDITFFHL